MRGIGGVGYIGGGKWTGSLTTLGPSPGSQHFHWFPLRSDLPGQGQAYTFIHLALYFMTVCTFVSMLPHCIFLHAM